MFSKRDLFKGAAAGLASTMPQLAQGASFGEIAPGPFKPDWDSLTAGYKAPDWFRDAKFGIWAHWSAQCVPEAGDWYARQMYIQGHKQYDHHLKTYGHPADNGFMEMDNRWKAENWNPGELLDLYKKAGARYFMSLANHHDNFDNYNSRFHDWNSTRVGPKRDIIGTWAKEARARGLKFGVSNHSAHSWHWFQTAYGYDPEGARAGQRYDAFKLTKYDGKGKWWEGLDPQELYAGAVMPMPDGITSIKDADAFHEAHDRAWNETPPLANPAFIRQWYLRCKDLIDSYRPDMVYFDNFDLPLGQAGLDITAHYYNSSIAWHGSLQAVVNCKALPENRRAAVVEDVERGFRADIVPHPWQTDTCLGDWHYNRARYTEKSYMSAAAVIYRLCDVVAKNGCLLLSVPVRGDGTIDSEERGIVEQIATWTSRYGEAIFVSRPWKKSGEGPTQIASGQFGEGKMKPFEAADIRFTTKGPVLYAMTLGRPSGTVTVASLANSGSVKRVEVVGSTAPLAFTQDGAGLHVTVPPGASHDFGIALKISGDGLV
ncbi:MAG: alpha-L-fucosidase [Alphaproteobacteria bacterium]|nr:alpha-L-fucosidase [Alphaproteobacteria bacterium]